MSEQNPNTPEKNASGLRERLQRELAEVKERASIQDWDGEEGDPVSDTAFDVASQLLNEAPFDWLRLLEIDATGFGEIEFSWDADDRKRTLIVAIQPAGEIAVAGIIDKIEIQGYVTLQDVGKSRLGDLVKWVQQACD